MAQSYARLSPEVVPTGKAEYTVRRSIAMSAWSGASLHQYLRRHRT
jgi:hypothetical protein